MLFNQPHLVVNHHMSYIFCGHKATCFFKRRSLLLSSWVRRPDFISKEKLSIIQDIQPLRYHNNVQLLKFSFYNNYVDMAYESGWRYYVQRLFDKDTWVWRKNVRRYYPAYVIVRQGTISALIEIFSTTKEGKHLCSKLLQANAVLESRPTWQRAAT